MERLGNISLCNADCMDIMRELPDKAFDLAIVDPPYGVGGDSIHAGRWADAVSQNNNFSRNNLSTLDYRVNRGMDIEMIMANTNYNFNPKRLSR